MPFDPNDPNNPNDPNEPTDPLNNANEPFDPLNDADALARLDDDLYEPIRRLSRDLANAAALLSPEEVRWLVATYYDLQEDRIAALHRKRTFGQTEHPHMLVDWLLKAAESFETNIKRALKHYAEANPTTEWALSIVGIGPVLASGLVATIGKPLPRTAGALWRFAGLDPTVSWIGREKATRLVASLIPPRTEITTDLINVVAEQAHIDPDKLVAAAVTPDNKFSRELLVKRLAKRPWNANLKRLAWLTGQSFMKTYNNQNGVYGHVYQRRREYEQMKNLVGDYAPQAQNILDTRNFDRDTEAYAWYAGCYTPEKAREILGAPSEQRLALSKRVKGEPGSGTQMLPPAHMLARACRYPAKLFLSHLHEVLWWVEHHEQTISPIQLMTYAGPEHTHYIVPPNLQEFFPEFYDLKRRSGMLDNAVVMQ